MAVDNSDNIIVAGYSWIGGNYDYFTVKYDPSGEILWADTIDNGYDDVAYGVAVDGSHNIIVTGFSEIVMYNDYLTVKYDPSGEILWADTIDNGHADVACGVAVDNLDNIIVTGRSKIEGSRDYFTVKYNPSGEILWADTIDNGGWDGARAVAVDNLNNIIVTGRSMIGTYNDDYFTVKYTPSTGVGDTEPGFMTSLFEIYPNPLSLDVNIRFTFSKKTKVNFGVYDVSGRLVQTLIDGVIGTGEHIISWDSSSLPSGVYFLKLNAEECSETKKLLKVR